MDLVILMGAIALALFGGVVFIHKLTEGENDG